MTTDRKFEFPISGYRTVVHGKGVGEIFIVLPNIRQPNVYSTSIILKYCVVDCPMKQVIGISYVSTVMQQAFSIGVHRAVDNRVINLQREIKERIKYKAVKIELTRYVLIKPN